LVKAGVHHLIVTKFARVASEEMLAVYDRRLSHFQITITSTDDDFASGYEGGSKVSERIAAIEKLQAFGYDVSIRLSPYVPDFVDCGALDLVLFNAIRCDKVLVEFLRMSWQVEKAFGEYIDPLRYTFDYGGKMHLPLEQKLIYIEHLLSGKPSSRVYTFTDVVPDHFEYIRDHFNPNKGDCCNMRL
jgi:DNA repair photolyase